jgi:hypothetical protein
VNSTNRRFDPLSERCEPPVFPVDDAISNVEDPMIVRHKSDARTVSTRREALAIHATGLPYNDSLRSSG